MSLPGNVKSRGLRRNSGERVSYIAKNMDHTVADTKTNVHERPLQKQVGLNKMQLKIVFLESQF